MSLRHAALFLALMGSLAAQSRPRIQVALLLDTSNSMDGLIHQAKSQLWTLVNRMAPLTRNRQSPELQVALYEYGKSLVPREQGHIRQVVPFTTDLDKISEMLFSLTTAGGDEYCGQAITVALRDLTWGGQPQDLRMIFIAGNEPFTQGSVDFRLSCRAAVGRDITVNTIFCGPYQEGVQTQWSEGAALGRGSYMHIDPNQREVHIPAPQDAEIERLGRELNGTYIPIGTSGAAFAENQRVQDTNAMVIGGSAMNQRARAKASSLYRAEAWDLVDAEKGGTRKLESLDRRELPREMQVMTPQEARAYVDQKARERKELQQRIAALGLAREAFLEARRKASTGAPTPHSLDAAMVEALLAQARAKGFGEK